MSVMTIPQVKQARQMAYDALKKKGYDPDLQITSKEQFMEVAKDIFADAHQERPGVLGLHVYNGTGGMFVALLERIGNDTLRQAIISEVNQTVNNPANPEGPNRYPGQLTSGAVSLLILRSGCTTADIAELGRISSGTTKYTNPESYPDFMRTPASRGLYLGSKFATV